MHTNRRDLMKLAAAGVIVGASPFSLVRTASAANIRVAMVVKALGIGFFDACRDGGLEAAKELGDVELIYTGPTKTDRRRPDRGDRRADRAEGRRHRDLGERPECPRCRSARRRWSGASR